MTVTTRIPEDDRDKAIISDKRRDIPTPAEFLPFIRGALEAVYKRLDAAGGEYGEEVIFLLNEWGAVTLCFTKASRLLWSKKKDKPQSSRRDSFLDLAGYAILEIARQAYVEGIEPEGIDGLFDRIKPG